MLNVVKKVTFLDNTFAAMENFPYICIAFPKSGFAHSRGVEELWKC